MHLLVTMRSFAPPAISYKTGKGEDVHSLEPTKRDRLLAEATRELSKGPHAVTSLKMSDHHLRVIAESKVRRLLGMDLSSFDEWLGQRKVPAAA